MSGASSAWPTSERSWPCAICAGPIRHQSCGSTYHLYDRAPDHLGPPIAKALGIPYVVAEASLAPSRAEGAWAEGHASVAAALCQAAAVIGLNPADETGVLSVLPDVRRYHFLPPFLDLRPFATVPAGRGAVAATYGLDPAGRGWPSWR
ncbi:MAG: hypothetical protein WDN69_37065 [Aliidongia sp.]